MKYINAEKLYKQVDELMAHFVELEKETKPDTEDLSIFYEGKKKMCSELLDIIVSLQQEQSEDVVSTANTLLEVLSKTPYNNKPITDAQIIVRQLLLFFENPKEYNPDAILEQPGVDLEKEIDKYCEPIQAWQIQEAPYTSIENCARHFYELGLKRKEK